LLLHQVNTSISIFIYKVPTYKTKNLFHWSLVQPFSLPKDILALLSLLLPSMLWLYIQQQSLQNTNGWSTRLLFSQLQDELLMLYQMLQPSGCSTQVKTWGWDESRERKRIIQLVKYKEYKRVYTYVPWGREEISVWQIWGLLSKEHALPVRC